MSLHFFFWRQVFRMGSARHCLPLLLYSAFGVLCTSIPPLVFSMVLTIKRKKVLLIFNKWYFVTALTENQGGRVL